MPRSACFFEGVAYEQGAATFFIATAVGLDGLNQDSGRRMHASAMKDPANVLPVCRNARQAFGGPETDMPVSTVLKAEPNGSQIAVSGAPGTRTIRNRHVMRPNRKRGCRVGCGWKWFTQFHGATVLEGQRKFEHVVGPVDLDRSSDREWSSQLQVVNPALGETNQGGHAEPPKKLRSKNRRQALQRHYKTN